MYLGFDEDYEALEECIKDGTVEYFLNGLVSDFGLLQQEYPAELGPYGCVELIYMKYNTDPESGIDILFHNAILDNFNNLNSLTGFLNNVIMVWIYHMMRSKQKTAPFEMESDDLRQALRDNLERNMEYYKSMLSTIDGVQCYYDRFCRLNDYYVMNYGIRILP